MTPAGEPDGLILIKLGGSLITDKTAVATARLEVIERLASELAEVASEYRGRLILGHGSGSFGHVAAVDSGLADGLGDADPLAACRVQHAAATLHRIVVAALLEAGVAAWSWAPSTAVVACGGRPAKIDLEVLQSALDLGCLPVVYGDVVIDRHQRAAVCSTEPLLDDLGRRLARRGQPVERVVWLGATDGIFDRQGKTIEIVDDDNYRHALAETGGAAGVDVTGGMRLRLRTARALARRGVESGIVDGRRPGALSAAVRGRPEAGGTRVVAAG